MRSAIVIIFIFILATVLLSGLATAQIPTSGNVFFGYTYYNTQLSLNRGSLNGWQGTLEGKLFPVLGIVADITGHYGSQEFRSPAGTCVITVVCSPVSANAHIYEVLFGPRVSVPVGKFRPFAEAEFGVGHVTTNGFGSDTSWATALGGGLDYRIFGPLGVRFEGDYVRTQFFSGHQNNARLSAGVVIRF